MSEPTTSLCFFFDHEHEEIHLKVPARPISGTEEMLLHRAIHDMAHDKDMPGLPSDYAMISVRLHNFLVCIRKGHDPNIVMPKLDPGFSMGPFNGTGFDEFGAPFEPENEVNGMWFDTPGEEQDGGPSFEDLNPLDDDWESEGDEWKNA